MRLPRVQYLADRKTAGKDSVAGLLLGVKSVPDGLASGLIAGVNPAFGLYAYMYGMAGAALFTGSMHMVVQGTGAMSAVIADVDAVHDADNPGALFTLTLLTGLIMLLAGKLRLGSILRFVSNSVLVGFISGVGVNIVLGQLDDLTGYQAEGGNRLARALDLLLHLSSVDLPTLFVGLATIAIILATAKTKIGSFGLILAIVVTSVASSLLDLDVTKLSEVAEIPTGLALPMLPSLGALPELIMPAVSLAFVGLVQGAGITASFPNPDGSYADPSDDFVGQGAGNVTASFFQGMPVGGSMSASSLAAAAGSTTRLTQLVASITMGLAVVVFGSAVNSLAMPALAGLLAVIGAQSIDLSGIQATWKTGQIQAVTMLVTFLLTIVVPLQFAVLVGVGTSAVLFVVAQSQDMVIRRIVYEDGGAREVDPPEILPSNDVVVLRPYGSLFFASASAFEQHLPLVTDDSGNSVVIIRLRGRTEVGSTLIETITRYNEGLTAVNSKMMLIIGHQQVHHQLRVTNAADALGAENIYQSNEWLGRTSKQAFDDASDWVGRANGS